MAPANKAASKKELKLPDGRIVQAFNPVIVSASRATDIPAFYADWFFQRLEVGYSLWTNPFNGVQSYVTYEDTKFIVFWSKNPRSLLQYLDRLKERQIGCYIQYSLNNYEKENYEPNVPPYTERIDTFRRLVDKLGPGSVIWRNDPLMLTDKIGMDELLRRLEQTGDNLLGYTEKLVFSFVDIEPYKKVKSNLNKLGIRYNDWTEELMKQFASELCSINKKWNYELATCAEKIDLSEYGIKHNHCIDGELIAKISKDDKKLMEYLGVKQNFSKNDNVKQGWLISDDQNPIKSKNVNEQLNSKIYDNDDSKNKKNKNKDSGQRKSCGCIASKDIGEYNTCKHFCVYCYANAGQKKVIENYNLHKKNQNDINITGVHGNP